MGLKVGDKAVYAAYGVGEVTGIERREISGRHLKFYIIRLLDSGMTVMVPTDAAASRGLRAIIAKQEVQKVFAILKQHNNPSVKETWNRRHRAYMLKLHTGSVFHAAEVVQELSLLRSHKDLSFSERRVLELARSMVVRELALARQTPESRVEEELNAIFAAK